MREALNQGLRSRGCPVTPRGFLRCCQAAPNLLHSQRFPCLLRGLLLAEQGTFLCSWAVRSSRHPAVPGGKREAEKEETEEGRQDYGFKNRRISGLIL